MSSLSGKVVIITGASSGIGEGVALHLATLGTRLSLFGRKVDNLERVAGECREKGTPDTQVLTVVGDVTIDEDRRRLINETIKHFGKLDVLVNNAGILRFQTVSSTSEEDFDAVFNTNIKGVLFLTQLAIPYLKQTKGSIVNNSSFVAVQSIPDVGMYGMSKAAIDMYTKCLALDVAPYGVRVNAISPGVIDTAIFRRAGDALADEKAYREFLKRAEDTMPLGRTGVPQDCAKVVTFLISDEANYITGQTVAVDGGRHCFHASPKFE